MVSSQLVRVMGSVMVILYIYISLKEYVYVFESITLEYDFSITTRTIKRIMYNLNMQ